MTIDQNTLSTIGGIAVSAGQEILTYYSQPAIEVSTKDDDHNSPLTKADLASHKLIVAKLTKHFDLPILSEEGTGISFDERKDWEEFWLIDPLDGTKEFIKHRDEFTVNIALIRNNTPVLGVVYAPALDLLYAGAQGIGAYKIQDKKKIEISVNDDISKGRKIVVSKSHINQETEDYLAQFENYEAVQVGSSLKLCYVAEGKAHLYPRVGPTMEWDTGAGDAVVRAAGGEVVELNTKKSLVYNKSDLHNPFFLARAVK